MMLQAAAAAIALLRPCLAAVQPYSNSAGVAIALQTLTNGSAHDLRFQLSVPSSSAWGGVGIGDGMAGALFFILYPNASRSGATVSVRTANDEVMPRQVGGIDYRVTNTSISNGHMVANVVCYSCKWPTLDFTSSKSVWMWAVGPGGSIASDNGDTSIAQHAQRGYFNLNLAASVTSESSGGAEGASNTLPVVPTSGTGSMTEIVDDSSEQRYRHLVIAHAILLPLTFLIFLPAAVLLLRFVSVRLHYAVNALATCMAIAGMAIAIRMTLEDRRGFMTSHQIIGLLAVCLLPLQALGGAIHHWMFKKHGKPTILGIIHLWSGRLAVLLGMLNISLGFKLSGSKTRAGAVGAASVIVYLSTFGLAIWQKRRRSKGAFGEKGSGSGSGSE